MSFVYFAHAPEDKAFAARLSSELTTKGIPNWYDDNATEEAVYSNLKQATHVVVLLSPAVLLAERVLAAMEHAKQQHLARLALRLTEMPILPPQIQGVIPLDFSDENAYNDNVATLIADLEIAPSSPASKIPTKIMEAIYSHHIDERRAGIESLAALRHADPAMKALAKEELGALVFRERDAALKQMLMLTMQSFEEENEVKPAYALPSKEELQQIASHSVASITSEDVFFIPPPRTHSRYLWQSQRWYVILPILALVLGIVPLIISGAGLSVLAFIPMALIQGWFNVFIRGNGAYEWGVKQSIIVNLVLGVLITSIGIVGLASIADGISDVTIAAAAGLGACFGGLIGWLASLKFDVVQGE